MPRTRTGTVFWSVDHWAVKVTLSTKPIIRHTFHFDPKVTKGQAKATGKLYSAQAKDGTLPHLAELLMGKRSESFAADFAELGESFETYSNRWLESPERKKLA